MTFYDSGSDFGSKKLKKNGSGSVSVSILEGRFRFGSSPRRSVPVWFQSQKVGSGSVPVPEGRFRFGFRFHFFRNHRTLPSAKQMSLVSCDETKKKDDLRGDRTHIFCYPGSRLSQLD
jgi:hypothetical protein